MACSRKALSAGYNTLSQRFRPSLVHIVQNDCELSGIPQSETLSPILLMQPPSSSLGLFSCFKSPARDCRRMGFCFPLGIDRSSRCFSSSAEGSNEIGGYMSDIADVLTDTKVDTAIEAATSTVPAPFPGEVAAAAADSFLPVAALQHLIDSVHSFSGLNWFGLVLLFLQLFVIQYVHLSLCFFSFTAIVLLFVAAQLMLFRWASIALTTLLIRGATVPLLINQLKATIKLNVMRPELEKLKAEIDKNMNPETFQENKKQMKALFKKHGVTPFTPLKGLFIQGPVFICFFVAIRNMVEKVPSFKGGGAYWFTDLTTPDDLYILPVLTAALFLATVELNMQEGMEGNPMASTMKKFSRGLGILTIPFTASIPKAIFCYWVTSNLFSLAYGFVMKRAPVRKLLNLPDGMIPKPSSALPPQPNLFSFSAGYKPTAASSVPDRKTASEQRQPNSISSSKDNNNNSDKSREGRQRSSPSAAISQRIRNLEKTVRSRTKPSKKR